jgi:hypothetical protein
MERAMRRHVETTSTPLMGWDKKATERPTPFMMLPKCAGVIVVKHGHNRQLARPLSVVQQQYLSALDVPIACFTEGQSRSGEGMQRHASPRCQSVSCAGWSPTTTRTPSRITGSHQALVRALHRDKGNSSHRLGTLVARDWIVMGRLSDGSAESLRLPAEGQKRVSQFSGNCD